MRMKGVLVTLLCLALALPVLAGEPQAPVAISTPEQLLQVAEDPQGSYILTEDLDMTGIPWKSIDFSGTFDGNGHAILNLTLSEPGQERPLCYDGNQISYAAAYVGLFGTLKNAAVKDLSLLNVRCVIETDEPCFVGAIAGFSDESTVTGCTVSGFLELRAHEKIFGVGGLVGYGDGHFSDCQVDVTLITTDTDPNTLDEQFMGGILAAGYGDIRNCYVRIDGYCSEYGYCHNGGMVGMLMRYPLAAWDGTVADNAVAGKITFFECNADRRAYCAAVIGEYMTSYYFEGENETVFLRDERMEYDRELRPEMCQNPAYTETAVSSGCDSYGYTEYTCWGCGYSYRDQYLLFDHIPGEWTVQKEPTQEEEGLSTAYCPCGQEFRKTLDKLEPPATTQAVTEPTSMPTEPQTPVEPERGREGHGMYFAVAAAVAAALALLLLLRKRSSGGKYAR